jgi:hypothetical protein
VSIQYYNLKNSIDLKEIGGDFPQVQRTYDGYDKKAPDSYLKVKSSAFPDFAPNLYYFTMNPKGKLTDMISTSMLTGSGSLVSERFKNLLEDGFTLAPHRFYPASLKYKGEFRNDYYWMHVVSDNTEYIDFEHTKCYIRAAGSLEKHPIEIMSASDLRTKMLPLLMESKFIESAEVFLQGKFYNQKLDCFQIGSIATGTFISKELKGRIIQEKITGVDMPPAAIAPL